jgi:hypothetical protein
VHLRESQLGFKFLEQISQRCMAVVSQRHQSFPAKVLAQLVERGREGLRVFYFAKDVRRGLLKNPERGVMAIRAPLQFLTND